MQRMYNLPLDLRVPYRVEISNLEGQPALSAPPRTVAADPHAPTCTPADPSKKATHQATDMITFTTTAADVKHPHCDITNTKPGRPLLFSISHTILHLHYRLQEPCRYSSGALRSHVPLAYTTQPQKTVRALQTTLVTTYNTRRRDTYQTCLHQAGSFESTRVKVMTRLARVSRTLPDTGKQANLVNISRPRVTGGDTLTSLTPSPRIKTATHEQSRQKRWHRSGARQRVARSMHKHTDPPAGDTLHKILL